MATGGVQTDVNANEVDDNIEVWKIKKLIKRLEAARGLEILPNYLLNYI